MLFKVENVAEAHVFLRALFKNSWGLGDLVVCAATWRSCKQLAYALLLEFSDPGNRRDIDNVVMRVKDSTVTFLSIGDGTKVRGRLYGKSLLLVTEGMPKEVMDEAIAGLARETPDYKTIMGAKQ